MTIPIAVMVATFTEFHSHSTGNGEEPASIRMLHAEAQRQLPVLLGDFVRDETGVAKLPERREIAITISSGNMIAAMKISRPKCVARRRNFLRFGLYS